MPLPNPTIRDFKKAYVYICQELQHLANSKARPAAVDLTFSASQGPSLQMRGVLLLMHYKLSFSACYAALFFSQCLVQVSFLVMFNYLVSSPEASSYLPPSKYLPNYLIMVTGIMTPTFQYDSCIQAGPLPMCHRSMIDVVLWLKSYLEEQHS